MVLEDFVEFRFLVGLEDDFFGAEAMFAGVLAGGGFAFLGARAGGVLGVGLVGFAAGIGGWVAVRWSVSILSIGE